MQRAKDSKQKVVSDDAKKETKKKDGKEKVKPGGKNTSCNVLCT